MMLMMVNHLSIIIGKTAVQTTQFGNPGDADQLAQPPIPTKNVTIK